MGVLKREAQRVVLRAIWTRVHHLTSHAIVTSALCHSHSNTVLGVCSNEK